MVTEAECSETQSQIYRQQVTICVVGVLSLGLTSSAAMFVGISLGHGFLRYLISAVTLIVIGGGAAAFMIRLNWKNQHEADAKFLSLNEELKAAVQGADKEAAKRDVQVKRQRFESRLANALDMAEGESEVIEVIERSLNAVMGEAPVELLLADNSHAHLLRMASSSPTGEPPGCGVDSPDRCPAARRAQVQRFSDSDDLDACPKLRSRPQGRLSALCVPVSIMGRTVGVIHATGEPGAAVKDDTVEDLGTLAKLAGARIGLLRVMAETQLQASTDSLTGLLNRRSFDDRVGSLRRSKVPMTLAMGDLDHFKELNDTYGHDTGDRALRLFSQVLRETVRSQDVICRHGGEEFAFAFPYCSAAKAREALDAVRARLSSAATLAGLPAFTASFGVAEATEQEDLHSVLMRADAALFEAKVGGRDRAVVHGADVGNANNVNGGQVDADAADLLRRLR